MHTKPYFKNEIFENIKSKSQAIYFFKKNFQTILTQFYKLTILQFFKGWKNKEKNQ